MVYPHVQFHGPGYPGQLQPTTPATARELDSRTSDGIQVRLLWHPDAGQLSVAVNDSKTGEVFEVPVGERDSALEVFHHPFAYADHHHQGAGRIANGADRAIAA